MAREIADDLRRKSIGNPTLRKQLCELGGLDVTACEVAGLAHDIGHPPFGHAGEKQLNKSLIELSTHLDAPVTFEGNAQSFRIVSRLEQRRAETSEHNRHGLNLTCVSLAGIAKYPWTYTDRIEGSPKYSTYDDDAVALTTARSCLPGCIRESGAQSVEAAIMDIADDITYATHDLEDSYRLGMINVYQVARDLSEARTRTGDAQPTNHFLKLRTTLATYSPLQFNEDEFMDRLAKAQTLFTGRLAEPYIATPINNGTIQQEIGNLVSNLVGDISVADHSTLSRTAAPVRMPTAQWHLAQILKVVTRSYVVQTPQMGLIQRAQSKAMKHLVNEIASWLIDASESHELPPVLATLVSSLAGFDRDEVVVSVGNGTRLTSTAIRAIGDYICSLADAEALARVRWLRGHAVPLITGA